MAVLRDHAEVRGALQRRHAYVLADEFQDSNALQLQLLTLLAPPPPPAADCSTCPEQAALTRALALTLTPTPTPTLTLTLTPTPTPTLPLT